MATLFFYWLRGLFSFNLSWTLDCVPLLEGSLERRHQGKMFVWCHTQRQIKIQPFPLHSHHETSGTVWRAWLWMGPARIAIECLRHVRFDIWKSEWLAFVSAPGLALALHVSCRAAWRKGRKRKVYISAQTDEHRLLECIWDRLLGSCRWSPALFQWHKKCSVVALFILHKYCYLWKHMSQTVSAGLEM